MVQGKQQGVKRNNAAEMQQTIPEADESFLKLFSPQDSINAREIYGATRPKQVRSQIDFWKKNLIPVENKRLTIPLRNCAPER